MISWHCDYIFSVLLSTLFVFVNLLFHRCFFKKKKILQIGVSHSDFEGADGPGVVEGEVSDAGKKCSRSHHQTEPHFTLGCHADLAATCMLAESACGVIRMNSLYFLLTSFIVLLSFCIVWLEISLPHFMIELR
jgi:hypothetical protein